MLITACAPKPPLLPSTTNWYYCFSRSLQSVRRTHETDTFGFLDFVPCRCRVWTTLRPVRGSFHFPGINIPRLEAGKYDGETTFEELRKHGDFGIGTVNWPGWRSVVLNGEFFQIKADGKVYSIAEQEKTPFAVVTFFKPDKALSLPWVSDMKELQETLDHMLPSADGIFGNKNCWRIQICKGSKRAPAAKAVSGACGRSEASNRI